MKRILMGVATSAMLIVTGCSNEEIVKEVANQNFTLNVSVGGGSRTFNGEDGKCLWGQNEQIYVTSQDGKVFGTLSMVSISDDKKSAVFSGPVNGHPSLLKYTIYPKPNTNGEIEIKSVIGGNHNAPMYGTISGGSSNFQYAGGLVKLDIDGAQGAKVNVPSGQTNTIGGTYKFNLETGKMEFYPGSSSVGIESIPADGVVYLPVATTAIVNGIEKQIAAVNLEVYVGSNQTPVSIPNVTVEEGKISTDDVPNIEVNANGTVNPGIVVTTAEELQAVLTESIKKNIKLGANITTTNIITISSDVVLDGNGKTLTYTGDDRAITVENTVASADVSINDLIVYCSNSSCERGINFNTTGKLNLNKVKVSGKNVTYALNLPGSSDNAQVNITKCSLTGCTALNVWGENAVISVNDSELYGIDASDDEGYSVIKLNNDKATSAEGTIVTVNGGRVEVKYSGNSQEEDSFAIENCTLTGNISLSETTVVIGGFFEPVAVVRYSNGTSYSYASLQEAIEDEGNDNVTINLLKDINLTEQLTIPANEIITIDLNGKTLSLKQPISVLGTLNLSNGTISSEGEVMVLGENGHVVIADNVVLNSGDGKGRIKNQGGQGTISASNLGDFIVYHEIENGNFESFMSLNGNDAYKNINTLVLKGTFTVDNTIVGTKYKDYGVNPTTYFLSTGNQFGGHVKRIEFTEGSSLDVRNNVGNTVEERTSIGFEDICILGDASIIGNENNESVIYFDRGTKITISEGKTLSLKNQLGLETGINPNDPTKGNALVTGKGKLKIVGNNVRINKQKEDPNAIILNVVVEEDTN